MLTDSLLPTTFWAEAVSTACYIFNRLKSDTREDVFVPKEKDKESVKREEEFEIKKPVLRYTKRKSLARKGLQKKPESAKSGTEEDVEAYMEERVDEPSSEEFPICSIPQGPAPAKIVKWQIIKTGKRSAYQIIREDNTDVVYVNFQGLLNDLTRDDLKELYRLMMLKYGDNRPEEEFKRVLWGDLKTMFDPPSTEDAVWNLTHQQKVLSWRYFHSCAVHCLTLEAAHIYMLTEVKYPLPPRVCKAMLEKKLLGDRKDEIQEVTPDPVDNFGPIFDDEPMHKDDQDDTDDLDQECDLLASLIQKLKCEIDDNKNQNKFLESSNKALVDKLKEVPSELDKYNDVNYASKVEIECAKAKEYLMSYKIDFEKSSNAYTRKINDLNQTISDMKKELCAHQETISIMSQAKEAQIKFYKTCEDKELDKVIALENKVKVLDDIIYKTGQSVQTMNMLNRNCKTSFAKPKFLMKAQRANPSLYDIGCYNDNLALMLTPESDEMIRFDKESRSKLSDLIRLFDYD
ncbi:hypothetical protein Tco_0869371 [Tanacetum coccineum]